MRRLDEIKGEEAIDVTADLFADITKVFANEKVQEMRAKGKGMADILAFVLKKRKSDVVHMLATLDGCTTKEYLEKTSIRTLLQDANDLMGDPLVGELFTLQGQNKSSANSGSVTDNTEAEQQEG